MLTRRTFLKMAAASAAALPRSAGAQQAARPVKGLIFLWMGGGQSQLDTWDPKPGSKHAGPFKAVETTVAGVKISENLPILAGRMEHLSIVRTVTSREIDPVRAEGLMQSGVSLTCSDVDPALGTILSYELDRRETPLPPFITMDCPRVPEALDFGRRYLPFTLREPQWGIPYVRSGLDERRDRARHALLRNHDQAWGGDHLQPEVERLRAERNRAEELAKSGVHGALELRREPEDLQKRYGEGRFGRNCLMARRFIEAGCSFVQVGLNGWDGKEDRLRALSAELDAGLGTLIQDLVERDLLKDVVVLCMGPYGRSPVDREAWSNNFSVVLAGGGFRGGQVHGDSGPDGLKADKPVPVHSLFATIYKACGIDPNKKYESEGRKMKYVSIGGNASTSANPISALLK